MEFLIFSSNLKGFIIILQDPKDRDTLKNRPKKYKFPLRKEILYHSNKDASLPGPVGEMAQLEKMPATTIFYPEFHPEDPRDRREEQPPQGVLRPPQVRCGTRAPTHLCTDQLTNF